MKRCKANKSFAYKDYSATAGAVLNIDDDTAELLADKGIVEMAKTKNNGKWKENKK